MVMHFWLSSGGRDVKNSHWCRVGRQLECLSTWRLEPVATKSIHSCNISRRALVSKVICIFVFYMEGLFYFLSNICTDSDTGVMLIHECTYPCKVKIIFLLLRLNFPTTHPSNSVTYRGQLSIMTYHRIFITSAPQEPPRMIVFINYWGGGFFEIWAWPMPYLIS